MDSWPYAEYATAFTVGKVGNVMSEPTYTERNGCLYVDFGQSADGTAARAVTPPQDTQMTEFMKEWLHMMTSQLRHNTLDGYWYMFRRHIEPFFSARRLTFRTLTRRDFPDFTDIKYAEGYSPTSLVKFHSILP